MTDGERADARANDQQVAEELRLLALALLDRTEPGLRALLSRLRDQEPAGHEHHEHHASTCTWCPLCAVVGLLRGERPELAAALGHHTDGLITTLRAALTRPAAEDDDRPEPRRVQRIEVRPADGTGGGC
jgi:hypothetical protein